MNDLFDRHCQLLFERQQYGDLYDTVQLAGNHVQDYINEHKSYFKLNLTKKTLVALHHSFQWPLNNNNGGSQPASRKNSMVNDLIDKRVNRLNGIMGLLRKDKEFKSTLLLMHTMMHHVTDIVEILQDGAYNDEWMVLMGEMKNVGYSQLREVVAELLNDKENVVVEDEEEEDTPSN